MANLDKNATLELIELHKISAIIRTGHRDLARDAVGAAVSGGFRIVEFTLTTPGALELIAEFARDDRLLVGAGTVLTTQSTRDAVHAGARYVVSPVTNPEVIRAAMEAGAVCIPGTFTPNEMVAAHEAGADFVKLFPAPADVADYVAAILGPLPFLKIFPTAGVTAENLAKVLAAGAAGAGFVRSLFDPDDLAEKNFAAIERRAADIVHRLSSR
jgi:Entner-Doudoroff aldolase